jgi:hypothetical protein
MQVSLDYGSLTTKTSGKNWIIWAQTTPASPASDGSSLSETQYLLDCEGGKIAALREVELKADGSMLSDAPAQVQKYTEPPPDTSLEALLRAGCNHIPKQPNASAAPNARRAR